MKNDFNIAYYNNNTRTMVFNGTEVVTKGFSKLPRKLIQVVANKMGLYLYGEICMYTGKMLYKAGIVNDNNGGVVNLITTYSKATFNKFICSYIKEAV